MSIFVVWSNFSWWWPWPPRPLLGSAPDWMCKIHGWMIYFLLFCQQVCPINLEVVFRSKVCLQVVSAALKGQKISANVCLRNKNTKCSLLFIQTTSTRLLKNMQTPSVSQFLLYLYFTLKLLTEWQSSTWDDMSYNTWDDISYSTVFIKLLVVNQTTKQLASPRHMGECSLERDESRGIYRPCLEKDQDILMTFEWQRATGLTYMKGKLMRSYEGARWMRRI